MRLAVVCVFLATFAATAWVIGPPPPARTGLVAVGPQPPTPSVEQPDWPPEALDPEDIACMNGLLNEPGWPREFRFLALRQLATHYLRPPADAARVAAVFRDRRWMAEAEITSARGQAWMGQPPPPGLDDFDQPVFWVRLLGTPAQRGVWWMVRVSGSPNPSVDDFKAFLRGEPSPLRIEQSGWLWEAGGIRAIPARASCIGPVARPQTGPFDVQAPGADWCARLAMAAEPIGAPDTGRNIG